MKKKITKQDRDALKQKLGPCEENGDSFMTKDVEVILENGWAYVHGRGDLGGVSTNITSLDELDNAIKRLRTVKG